MNDSTVAATKTIKEEAETSAGMFIMPTNTQKSLVYHTYEWFSYLVYKEFRNVQKIEIKPDLLELPAK